MAGHSQLQAALEKERPARGCSGGWECPLKALAVDSGRAATGQDWDGHFPPSPGSPGQGRDPAALDVPTDPTLRNGSLALPPRRPRAAVLFNYNYCYLK